MITALKWLGGIPRRIWRQMLDADGRRAMTFLALRVAGFIMTGYAVAALWLVRNEAEYAFGLGLAAMGLVAIILTGDVALFVKRTLKLSRDGIEMSDQTDQQIGAQKAADQMVAVADAEAADIAAHGPRPAGD